MLLWRGILTLGEEKGSLQGGSCPEPSFLIQQTAWEIQSVNGSICFVDVRIYRKNCESAVQAEKMLRGSTPGHC